MLLMHALNAILDLSNMLKTSPMLDTADDQACENIRAKDA